MEVTADDLATWLGACDWITETKRSHRSALISFFDWAVGTERMTRNPAHGLPSVRRSEGRPRPTPEDVLADALATADDRVRVALLLAARLGMRRGEIARASDADLVRDIYGWSMRVHGKGGKLRVVPVQDDLAALLRTLPPGPFVPSELDGSHMTPAHVGKLVSRALPDAWTCHTLRHRYATVTYSAQRDLLAVQTLLGHSSPETTRRYVALPGDALRAAAAAA